MVNSNEYKVKDWSPKFNKKAAEVMRTYKIWDETGLISKFENQSFVDQQNYLKQTLAKNLKIKLITSFNERTVFAVCGINDEHQIFYCVEKEKQLEFDATDFKELF